MISSRKQDLLCGILSSNRRKGLKNMTSININKEKFGQLIHKEKMVLYRDEKAIDSIVALESKK